MGDTLNWLRDKLQFLGLMSSFLLILSPFVVRAHEVTPTIGDLQIEGGVVVLELRLNVEAFLAGIDLDGLEDTNASDQSGVYDRFRGLAPDDLAAKVRAFGANWGTRVEIRSDGGRGAVVDLNLASVEVGEVGDIDLPRVSYLVLKGAISPDARSLTLTWAAGSGDLVLRQQGVKDPYTGYVAGGETSPVIALAGGGAQTGMQAFMSYIPVGFDHILPKGLDHILFVLGLFFLSARLGPLLWQISAFTVAHTVTLALGASGVVQINPNIVEPLIAATIVFVAVENVISGRMHRWRPVVVFGFGLLHGLGFAAVLGEFGLPEQQFLPALIGFNVGVELGQLTVIAAAFLSVGLWFGRKPWYRGRIAIPASMGIAFVGAYWFVERVFL
ncbi:MAG: HupE/UreJ family protein [Rhodobacteraceae bacterium]|nr:HupE/UreJ family protein [Paracoccaceae bacterium]